MVILFCVVCKFFKNRAGESLPCRFSRSLVRRKPRRLEHVLDAHGVAARGVVAS